MSPASTLWAAILIVCPPLTALAVDGVEVLQTGRRFGVEELHIRLGGVVHFVNSDDFDHQIYIAEPNFSFESDEQEPGTTVSVAFTRSGVFTVRCHIHPKMHVSVTVSDAG